MSLVVWIAITLKLVEDLLHYMDDAFGYDMDPQLEYYALYDQHYPKKQVALLRLWDEIGLPHSKKKQEYGQALTIIGFRVDPVSMTLSLPLESRKQLIQEIRDFTDSSKSRRHPLRRWQQLLGYANWALNVFPLLRPALTSSYDKIAGKSFPNALIFLNRNVIKDLSWFAQRVEAANGLHFFKSLAWLPAEADMVVYCDASTYGLGFWIPSLLLGFHSQVPQFAAIPNILFYEAVTVASAIAWVADRPRRPRRLLLYTDSLDSVEMFHSLCAKPGYNDILLFVVKTVMDSRMSHRVRHIAGSLNVVADALSRGLLHVAAENAPGLCIHAFQPPQDALGVAPQ